MSQSEERSTVLYMILLCQILGRTTTDMGDESINMNNLSINSKLA